MTRLRLWFFFFGEVLVQNFILIDVCVQNICDSTMYILTINMPQSVHFAEMQFMSASSSELHAALCVPVDAPMYALEIHKIATNLGV